MSSMKMKRIFKYLVLAGMVFMLQSCYNTYFMSANNLHQELNKIKDSTYAYKHKFYDVILFTKYFNNGLTQITCYDKAGKAYNIGVYSNTEAIVYLKNGDANRFIFRTMFAKDTMIYGQLSFPSTQISLKLNDIQAVKIRNPQ